MKNLTLTIGILIATAITLSVYGQVITFDSLDTKSPMLDVSRDSLEVKVEQALTQSIKELSICSEEYKKWFIGNFIFKRGQMDFRTKPIPRAPPKY